MFTKITIRMVTKRATTRTPIIPPTTAPLASDVVGSGGGADSGGRCTIETGEGISVIGYINITILRLHAP